MDDSTHRGSGTDGPHIVLGWRVHTPSFLEQLQGTPEASKGQYFEDLIPHCATARGIKIDGFTG